MPDKLVNRPPRQHHPVPPTDPDAVRERKEALLRSARARAS